MGRLERQKLPIPFGEGLDRATGVTKLQATQFEDLRNVLLFEGKAEIRKGYERRSTLTDNVPAALDRVLGLHSLRSESAGMAVGFDDTSKEAFLNFLSLDGVTVTPVASGDPNGRLFLLDGGAQFDPPSVHMVDTFNRMFIAHDEPVLTSRNATRVWSGLTSPEIIDLEADLDDDGTEAPVKFRGVTRHLSYLVGWGYGTDADPDRPDVVRVSLAGDPTLFDPRHFFHAGQRSEPVMVCRTAGNLLLVFKETETFEIFGYSPETFGIRPADTLFGCIGSRLAVTVAGAVFFWSTQGPRMSAGGESIDLAIPLDIGGPDPATLVAESEPQEAFAVYSATDRVVMFVWGRRVYALSIRQPNRLRWSYYELGANAEPFSGGSFFPTSVTSGGGVAPVGWPLVGGANDGMGGGVVGPPPALPIPTDTTIEFEIFNTGGGGLGTNEVLEVHVKDVDGTGGWIKKPDISLAPARAAGGPNFEQTVTVTGLKPAQEYEVSMRYRGGGAFTPGFGSGDPDTWNDPACPACPDNPPAYVPGLFTTVSAPILPSRGGNNEGKWERVNASVETIRVPITIPADHELLVMEVEIQRFTIGDTAVQDIGGTGMGPPDTANQSQGPFAVIEPALAAASTSYLDSSPVPEQLHSYRMRFLAPGNAPDGPFSNILPCHAGPDPPTAFTADCSGGAFSVITSWANTATPVASDPNFPRVCPPPTAAPDAVPLGHLTETWFANKTQAPTTWLPNPGDPAGVWATGGSIFPIGGMTADLIRAAVRHRVECSPGIFDYSRWSGHDACNIFGP